MVKECFKSLFSRRSENRKVTVKDLMEMEKRIMAKLDDIISDVEAESTLEDSVLTLLTGIKQQLTDALSGVTLPPVVQVKVDDAFAKLEANKTKLSDALVSNTPQA